jgi:hypothetical protein
MTATVNRAQPDILDHLLVLLFLLGIYLGFDLHVAAGVPIPAALAGASGLALLMRRAPDIREQHAAALLGIILLLLLSILCAGDYRFLLERFKGLIQITYALLASYGVFLTILRYDRGKLAPLFLGFCIVILIGCALEKYTGFRAVSDAVRQKLYATNLYESDMRDQELYGGIRPKFFTSEPSAVTFAFTLYGFAWFVLSRWRWKLAAYLALLAAGFVLMRGPTLLLAFVLVVPYEIFLGARQWRDGEMRYSINRLAITLGLSVVLLAASGVIGATLYAERIRTITEGTDPSFFYRIVGPAYVAFAVMEKYPFAGAGLTGEEFIQDLVVQVYATAPSAMATGRYFDKAASVLTNYFWLHWIYLGAIWGGIMVAALCGLLRALAVPSLLFCWVIWIIFGQSSGAYVSPKTWTVLLLSGAIAILHERQAAARSAPPRHAPGQPRVFRPVAATR